MWKLIFDHHTHTIFSHGKGTIEDNVKEARRKGLKSVGITDHGPGHLTYGVKRENLPVMRREVDALNEKYSDIKVLLGVEANIWEPGNHLDITEEDKMYLDYVIAGYHYGVRNGHCVRNFVNWHTGKRTDRKLLRINTDMMVRAIEENDLYILTHPGDKGPFDIDEVAKACERRNVLMEINTKHPHLNEEEIRIAMKYDVKFVLSSDAHVPSNVGDVEAPLSRAMAAGLDPARIVNLVWTEE